MGEGHETSRYTVRDAAEILGISEGALRNRLYRGTLRSVRDGGTVYVLLPADMSRDIHRDPTEISDTERLIAELQDRVRSLEEANRENRRIIAMLASRVPELESPSEASESPETPTEEAGDTVTRLPWYRRIFR